MATRAKVSRKAWEEAAPIRADDAAELYGVGVGLVGQPGMELIGWTWEYSDGSFGIVKRGANIRSHYQPVAMRRVWAELR